MLFGHEFEVEANDFSLQITNSAMMIVETDRSLNPTSRRIGNNDS
jgi:hypothetical protein